jgi:hypothetical protein
VARHLNIVSSCSKVPRISSDQLAGRGRWSMTHVDENMIVNCRFQHFKYSGHYPS